jgi:hypothetical protein
VAIEPSGSSDVCLAVGVLTAIGPDDQQMSGAGEINDKRADRVLPAELEVRQPPTSQCRPQAYFRIGWEPPKCARDAGHRQTLWPSQLTPD